MRHIYYLHPLIRVLNIKWIALSLNMLKSRPQPLEGKYILVQWVVPAACLHIKQSTEDVSGNASHFRHRPGVLVGSGRFRKCQPVRNALSCI